MSIAALGVKRSITPMPVGVGSSPCLGGAIPKPTYSLSLALVKEKVLFIASLGPDVKLLAWRFVLNTRSGTYHRRVAVGVSSAACGWSFATWPHALVPDAKAGPKSHAQLCSRCWPSLLASAKSSGVLHVLEEQSSSSSSGSAAPAP